MLDGEWKSVVEALVERDVRRKAIMRILTSVNEGFRTKLRAAIEELDMAETDECECCDAIRDILSGMREVVETEIGVDDDG